jgi:hypothetical protein
MVNNGTGFGFLTLNKLSRSNCSLMIGEFGPTFSPQRSRYCIYSCIAFVASGVQNVKYSPSYTEIMETSFASNVK